MSITVEIGNGATRQSPAYEITRDGFALLCMGFTGKKALAFKLTYIDAFNKMEAELRAVAPQSADHILNTTIGTDGFHVLGMLIDGKVRHLPPHARRSARLRVWAQVHRAFGVASAENIPADQMDSARNFVAAYVVEGEWQARDEFKHKAGATPAESLHNSRWLLTFDHTGKTHLTPIPQDACVMSPESLLFAIGNHEIHIDSETLATFMLAGLERLEPDHLMRIAGVSLGKLAPTAVEEADRGDIAALRSFPADVQADIEARAWRLTGQAHARIISYVAGSVALCAGHGQDVSKPAAQHRLEQITLEDALSLTAREMTMLLGMADHIAKTAVEYTEAVRKGMQALLERGMVIGPVVNAGRAA